MKLTKEHEGKTIYAIPTGNGARHWDKVPFEFEVIKVKRVFAELKNNRSYLSGDYDILSGHKKGGSCNSGFVFFNSIEDIDKHKRIQDIRLSLAKKFSRGLFNISEESLIKINDILADAGEL